MQKTYIKCERCGKIIEKKQNRTLCIKCVNIRNKEVQAKYREELREMKKEAWL